MSEEIPSPVLDLATEHHLGSHSETLLAAVPKRPLMVSAILTVILGGMSAFVCVLSLTNPALAMPSGTAWLLLLPAAAGIATTAVIYARSPLLSARARDRKIYVFEQGFVQVAKAGLVVCRWDKVQTVFQEIVQVGRLSSGLMYRYRLVLVDGREVKLTHHIVSLYRLGPIITDQATQAQLPRALAHLSTGQNIKFGDIAVNSDVLTVGKFEIRWTQLNRLEIGNGEIWIFAEGRKRAVAAVPIGDIPNAGTFLAVADQFLSLAQGVPAGRGPRIFN